MPSDARAQTCFRGARAELWPGVRRKVDDCGVEDQAVLGPDLDGRSNAASSNGSGGGKDDACGNDNGCQLPHGHYAGARKSRGGYRRGRKEWVGVTLNLSVRLQFWRLRTARHPAPVCLDVLRVESSRHSFALSAP